MSRDLYMTVFSALSQFSEDEFDSGFESKLPAMIFDSATDRIREFVRAEDISDIYTALASRQTVWKNPELYPHLIRLHECDRVSIWLHLSLLRVHLGLAEPEGLLATEGGGAFFRMRNSVPKTYRRSSSSIEEIQEIVCRINPGEELLVYRPYQGLFDDIAPRLYRGHESYRGLGQLKDLTVSALKILEQYSPEISAGFRKTIGTLAFTSDDYNVTKSYSMRRSYLGGVFSSICAPLQLTENLIHEYYHCRIWKWWLIEAPSDLPPLSARIVSPITGAEKSVQVMMHGLLIYVSLMDYYRWQQDVFRDNLPETLNLFYVERLNKGICSLIDILYKELKHCPEARSFVSLVSDVYKSYD